MWTDDEKEVPADADGYSGAFAAEAELLAEMLEIEKAMISDGLDIIEDIERQYSKLPTMPGYTFVMMEDKTGGWKWVTQPIANFVCIAKIEVWVNHDGTDKLILHTTLPLPGDETQNAALFLNASANTGIDYCKKHFPDIPVEISSPIRSLKTIY